jgi:hypothetical protein
VQIFKKLLDFYINASIHVAFSAFALVNLTFILFEITNDNTTYLFAFFGTIVGYNFVKYVALIRSHKTRKTPQLKGIICLSFLSFAASVYYFLQLQSIAQIFAIVVLAVTIFYTLPFFPNRKSTRNWAGFKIYIVASCWVGVTLFLPILNNQILITDYVYVVATQRFILFYVLILIFEIIDLKHDAIHLKTVPQQIGVSRTKWLGVSLMILFVSLEFLSSHFKVAFFVMKICLALTSILFLIFVNENRSRYYASFWAESIPIFWWITHEIY